MITLPAFKNYSSEWALLVRLLLRLVGVVVSKCQQIK